MSVRRLYTIGFTKTSAAHFFERLRGAGVRTLFDTRLHASSQLSGFAKANDLAYFVPRLLDAAYLPVPELAPTAELLTLYRTKQLSWNEYAAFYLALIESRNALQDVSAQRLENACLLCSEHVADTCHRRLAAEYLAQQHGGFEVVHL